MADMSAVGVSVGPGVDVEVGAALGMMKVGEGVRVPVDSGVFVTRAVLEGRQPESTSTAASEQATMPGKAREAFFLENL